MPTKSLVSFIFPAFLALTFSLKAQTEPANQGISSTLNPMVSFFRNTESRFPSGEAHRRDLEKNWLSDRYEFSYLIQSGQKQRWVNADSLARDLQLSQFVYSERTAQNYRVIRTEGSHILGEAENGKSLEWLPLQELSPLPDDLGIVITLTTTLLRESPSWKSDSLISLPPKTRIRLIKFEDGTQATWALVEFESIGKIRGWVDLNNILTKFDFAAFAMTKEMKWTPVSYRQGSELITPQQTKIPLSQVTAIMTRPELGVSLVTDDSHHLLLRQNLTIIKIAAQSWSLSRVNGHGDVYWKKNSDVSSQIISLQSPLMGGDQVLTTEQLLKRELNSVSFHPKNSNLGLASSQGIYLTADGKLWNKLSQFKNQSHAVLVDPQGVLYVGSLRSYDSGKSFHPFLRLESLAHLIEQKQHHPPNQMRISSLSNPSAGVLQMDIETDLGRLRLASRNSTDTMTKWDFN